MGLKVCWIVGISGWTTVLSSHRLLASRPSLNPLVEVLLEMHNHGILPWVAYPGTMVITYLVFIGLSAMGISIIPSAYLAAVLGAGVVTALEFLIPYNRSWQPLKDDVKNDLLFMVTVQMVLPQILTLFFSLTLLRYLQGSELPVMQWWPHHLPLVMQVLLMLLAAEFFRYWFHVASHNTQLLWRFHAVHHSPKKLYWLNVGRFHPVDKAFQYLLDALPFIALGVSEPVLALYFIFYAVNGFFQHSNVDARYGILNYVVSGAELHRWHHSRVVDESNRNYGNNLIVWDLVFRSWFLPRNRCVGELGLINRAYPLDFMGQLGAPLTPGLDKHPHEDH